MFLYLASIPSHLHKVVWSPRPLTKQKHHLTPAKLHINIVFFLLLLMFVRCVWKGKVPCPSESPHYSTADYLLN